MVDANRALHPIFGIIPLSDLDLCACGHYRRDHENRAGRCTTPNEASPGFEACQAFRPFAYQPDEQ